MDQVTDFVSAHSLTSFIVALNLDQNGKHQEKQLDQWSIRESRITWSKNLDAWRSSLQLRLAKIAKYESGIDKVLCFAIT